MNYEILIVDDHPLFRAALTDALASACSDCEFLEADSVAALFEALERHPHTDLLLLDLNLPGAHGFCALAHLRGLRPQLPVILVSATDDQPTVHRALALGAQGFVSKSADAGTIGRNVASVLRGEYVSPAGLGAHTASAPDPAAHELARALAGLSAQQFQVFGLLCSGLSDEQIAGQLRLAAGAVKAQVEAILRQLGAADRARAVLQAGRLSADKRRIGLPPEQAA
jgi:DNA-binding NarL/FixJ family response regulator